MKKNFIKNLFILGAFLLAPGFALAAPSVSSISGTISSGQTVIINGSAFGTRSDYHDSNQTGQLNWSWQPWRDGVLQSNGYATTQSNNSLWSMPTSGARIAGTTFARAYNSLPDPGDDSNNDNVDGEQRTAGLSGTPPPGTYYITYWQRIVSPTFSGKIARFASPDAPGFGAGGDFWVSTSGLSTDSSSDMSIQCWSGSVDYTQGIWQRVELLVNANTNTQQEWIVGQNGNNGVWAGQNYQCGSLPTPNLLPSAGGSFQDNIGAGIDPQITIDFSDLYVDFTQARVEICDTSTWAARSHCEIQIPTAWSSTNASINVNQGSFTNGSAFLYVIDVNGNVSDQNTSLAGSQGYPITFGAGSADTTAPAAPSGLQIQ